MVIRAEIQIRLPYEVSPEDGVIIASCTPLDVHSQGNTEPEAVANLQEALQLFIETCFEAGTLDKVLKQAGFNKIVQAGVMRTTLAAAHPGHYLDIPLELLGSVDAENHAP